MLTVTIPKCEFWDEKKSMFVYYDECTLVLEHSLVSVSKWESKWKKAFLKKTTKTYEETKDYIRCMTITKNVDPNVYDRIPSDVIDQINKYIEDPMTAVYFPKTEEEGRHGDVVTSEVIYWWMIINQIPVEFQKWHLNRLLALIRVCNMKNSPPKKMSQKELAARNAKRNAERRNQHHTKG